MYWLIFWILVAIIAVFYAWYQAKRLIPDVIDLSTEEDRLLNPWYQRRLQVNHPIPSNLLSMCIQRLYGYEIDPNLLVIGKNLDLKYYRLTHQLLPGEHTGPFEDTPYNPKIDYGFDLRRTLGLDVQIGVIHDPELRRQLQSDYDVQLLNNIMVEQIDSMATAYLERVLQSRWNKIIQLGLTPIKTEGTYLYISQYTNVDDVMSATMNDLQRINLLCTDMEFDALVNRHAKIELA